MVTCREHFAVEIDRDFFVESLGGFVRVALRRDVAEAC